MPKKINVEESTFECPKCHRIYPSSFAVKFSIHKDSKTEFTLGCINCVHVYIADAAKRCPLFPPDLDGVRNILFHQEEENRVER